MTSSLVGHKIVLTPGPAAETALLRDLRCGFSLALPGHPELREPTSAPGEPAHQALVIIPDLGVHVRYRLDNVPVVPPQPGPTAVALAQAYLENRSAAKVQAVLDAAARATGWGAAAMAAALYPLRQRDEAGHDTEEIVVLVRPAAVSGLWAVYLSKRFAARDMNPIAWSSFNSAVTASMRWDPAGGLRPVPQVWPESAFFEPGLPLRLKPVWAQRIEATAAALAKAAPADALGELGKKLARMAAGGEPPIEAIDDQGRRVYREALETSSPNAAVAEILRPGLDDLGCAHDLRGWVHFVLEAVGRAASFALRQKWQTLPGGDAEGLLQPVPEGVPVGVVALERADGTVRYRDGRCGLEIEVAGRVQLESPAPGWDARLISEHGTIDLRLDRGAPAAPDATVIDHPPFRYAMRREGSAEPAVAFRWRDTRLGAAPAFRFAVDAALIVLPRLTAAMLGELAPATGELARRLALAAGAGLPASEREAGERARGFAGRPPGESEDARAWYETMMEAGRRLADTQEAANAFAAGQLAGLGLIALDNAAALLTLLPVAPGDERLSARLKLAYQTLMMAAGKLESFAVNAPAPVGALERELAAVLRGSPKPLSAFDDGMPGLVRAHDERLRAKIASVERTLAGGAPAPLN